MGVNYLLSISAFMPGAKWPPCDWVSLHVSQFTCSRPLHFLLPFSEMASWAGNLCVSLCLLLAPVTSSIQNCSPGVPKQLLKELSNFS